MKLSDYSFSANAIYQDLDRKLVSYSANTILSLDNCYCLSLHFMGKPIVFCIFSSPLIKNSNCNLLFQTYDIDGRVGELESMRIGICDTDLVSVAAQILDFLKGRMPYNIVKEAKDQGLF